MNKNKQIGDHTTNTNTINAAWPELSTAELIELKALTDACGVALSPIDFQSLNGHLYVTHSGLLRIAAKRRCSGIRAQIVTDLCDPQTRRWVVRATVFTTPRSLGFVGYGDADPSNVSSLVHGAEMRVAETRAVNRALRKAYGIGLCSVEEIGPFAGPISNRPARLENLAPTRLRDQLYFFVGQNHLDARQVKRYAIAFCGVPSLRDATREQVERFLAHLCELAAEGRGRLLEQLAPFAEEPPDKAEAA